MSQLLVALIGGVVGGSLSLCGVLVGSWLTERRERTARRHAFVRQQLQELYSPLLGIREEIRTRGVLRAKLQSAADRSWRGLVEDARQQGGVPALQELRAERSQNFEAMITWDNNAFCTSLLPAYRQMIDLFRKQLWLADDDTVPFLTDLVEFVEVWERFQVKSIPIEVVQAINHREENLTPFYEHLERKHIELRAKLANT